MAEIDLERRTRGGTGWLWAVLGVAVLALLVWWAWPEDEEADFAAGEIETVEPVEPATTPEVPPAAAGASIGDILSNPQDYIGQAFPGARVRVADVPTDRGFWIEDQGQRLFAVIIDRPAEEPKDINPGQTLRIEGGMLRDASFLAEIPGAPLDEDTRSIAEEQEVLLVVDEAQISITEAGQPQPGTDTAESVQPNR